MIHRGRSSRSIASHVSSSIALRLSVSQAATSSQSVSRRKRSDLRKLHHHCLELCNSPFTTGGKRVDEATRIDTTIIAHPGAMLLAIDHPPTHHHARVYEWTPG
jgi:hypothetical protein